MCMRTLIVSAGLLGMLGFVSCEKDHNCVCFDSSNEVTHTYTYGSTTRDDARDMCAAAAVQLNETDSIGETYICTLE